MTKKDKWKGSIITIFQGRHLFILIILYTTFAVDICVDNSFSNCSECMCIVYKKLLEF